MRPGAAIWSLLAPIALLGVANGFMWSPLSTTATRNLPMHQAGAGSGVYNTTRQIGAVLGSAGIAVLMQSRLTAELPGAAGNAAAAEGGGGQLPAALQHGFASAMAQSMLLPAAVLRRMRRGRTAGPGILALSGRSAHRAPVRRPRGDRDFGRPR